MMRMKVRGGGKTFLPPWVEPRNPEAKNWGFSMIRGVPFLQVYTKRTIEQLGKY